MLAISRHDSSGAMKQETQRGCRGCSTKRCRSDSKKDAEEGWGGNRKKKRGGVGPFSGEGQVGGCSERPVQKQGPKIRGHVGKKNSNNGGEEIVTGKSKADAGTLHTCLDLGPMRVQRFAGG